MAVLTGIVGLRLSTIDLAEHRLPNRLIIPLFLSLVVVSLAWGQASAVREALAGSVITGVAYVALALMPGQPLGWGDVKFQFGLGWLLGYLEPSLAIMGAAGSFLLGGLSLVPRLMREKTRSKDPVPLGPWMMASTCLVYVVADSLKII